MRFDPLLYLFMCAAIVACSLTIAASTIFAPLRAWLKPVPMIGHLIQCYWCLNHWFSLGGVLWLFNDISLEQMILMVLATITFTTFPASKLYRML